ncbi:hypothetical protein [Sagittula sp. SSi028]|uniref:hypothetical protein n=1 Tax=Sagittula sp. SSi028 TaxID=3400636 RepID=UPI003AF9F41A
MLRIVCLLLPALVPSWRFFREIAPSPRVELRVNGGPWRAVMPPPYSLPARTLARRLLWSPERNAALYLVSLAERIVDQGSLRAEAELCARLARDHPDTHRLQMRLVFISRTDAGITRETLFQSAPFPGADRA